MDRDNTHRKDYNMNINKIVKDSVNGIKDKYKSTQLNPFKIPEHITITHKFDIVNSYGDIYRFFKGLSPEKVKEIATVCTEQGKMIESIIKDRFK